MTPDDAHKNTDKTIAIIEKRLKKEYEKAIEDVQSKMESHFQKYEVKDKAWQTRVVEGKATKTEHEQWRIGQMAIGERWESLRNRLAVDMSHANRMARDIVESYRSEVFADNFNYTTYNIEKNLNIDTDFTTYNKKAVEQLMIDNPEVLPSPGKRTTQRILSRLDVRWNRQQLQSITVQALMQGKSISEVAADIAKTFGEKNQKSAIRNARTMMTAAENAGRQYGFERANKMGLEVAQQWVATLDNRTRYSHRLLDGEIRKVGEKFSNGCRYPGDPKGKPKEVYNCFVGDTSVATNCEIKRTYKHEYKGNLITVKSASGVNFTCTPNHPILTNRGWIRANTLHNGDNLVVTFLGNKFFSRWNPHIKHIHSRFDALHELFYVFGGKRVSTLSVNFHGDVPTSDVEIITKKRLLRNNGNPFIGKNVDKFFFEDSYKSFLCNGSFVKHFVRVWKSAFDDICSKSKFFAFFWWCLAHAKVHGLRPVAWGNSGRFEPIGYDASRNFKLFSKCLNGFSGIICFDEIVNVDVNFSHCDVFNLQSENGYYFVNSSIPQNDKLNNDIVAISHNCRCCLIGAFDYLDNDLSNLSRRHVKNMGDMSYSEWKNTKKSTSKPIPLTKMKKIF